MFSSHYYHGTIRKAVSAFGTLFNNISVVKKDANNRVISSQRVPLAYGPKQKFLTRLDEQPDPDNEKVALKLPRMSFEITGMTYDPSMRLNRNQRIVVPDSADPDFKRSVRTSSPWRLLISLSILSKTQDDALQVLEQILPNFQPEYTLTMKDVEGMNIENDVPVVLIAVDPNDGYEGDAISRRTIVFTLSFEMRIRFYGPSLSRAIIKSVDARISQKETLEPMENINVHIEPLDAAESETHSIQTVYTYLTDATSYKIVVQAGSGAFTNQDTVVGTTSGSGANVVSFSATTGVLVVSGADGPFRAGETITGSNSGCSRTIGSVEPIFS